MTLSASRLRPLLAVALLAWLTGGAVAQRTAPPGADKGWADDPYTKGDPKAVAAAGYVQLGGTLPWGDDHSSQDIEEILGSVPLIWVETEHFRIGSSLPEHVVEQEERAEIKADLKRLKKRVPRVKDTTRKLDPWLRLHLYAMRLEEQYEHFRDLAGVVEGQPPVSEEQTRLEERGGEPLPEPDPDAPPHEPPPVYGCGPFLGCEDKFLVLLLEKQSSLGRYGQRYVREPWADGSGPMRISFHRRGSLGFATTAEFFEGKFGRDVAFHAHVAWNVSAMLLDGLRGYRHLSPRWLSEGLGHWYQRRISDEYPSFSHLKEPMDQVLEETKWGVKVRKRVKQDYYPAAADLMTWPRGQVLKHADHIMMWSRVDYLVRARPEEFGRFLIAFKAPIPVKGRTPTVEEIDARQLAALQDVLGLDAEGFDAAWAEWVLDTYPKR